MMIDRSRKDAGLKAALPTFLLIGATKCGTTSMHDWLSRHPDVFMHPWKEMRFFLSAGRWDAGPDWYARQFADRGTARAWGEASNAYMRGAEHANVPQRVAQLLPDARFICIVREPMARMVSHYRHRIVTGREWRSFDDAVLVDPAYVDTGLYGAELARWHAHVDASRILVVPFEGLAADARPWLDRVATHLGVDKATHVAFQARNVSDRRRPLPSPLRRLGAWPAMRPALKRLGKTLPTWGSGMMPTPSDLTLPPRIARDVAARFAADRVLLERLAGPQTTGAWP